MTYVAVAYCVLMQVVGKINSLPMFSRTIRSEKPTAEEIEKLIECPAQFALIRKTDQLSQLFTN
jgi:hypothetical protein